MYMNSDSTIFDTWKGLLCERMNENLNKLQAKQILSQVPS